MIIRPGGQEEIAQGRGRCSQCSVMVSFNFKISFFNFKIYFHLLFSLFTSVLCDGKFLLIYLNLFYLYLYSPQCSVTVSFAFTP